jgi:hypothetical protein
MNDVVGADTFETGILHSLLDDTAIGLVKIVGLPLLEVGLLAKSYHDKAIFLAQALLLVRFCCSFLFCLMDEGLGNLGV